MMKFEMKPETVVLGDLIEAFEDIRGDKTIMFDFGNNVPSGISSWRGVYAELAIHYEKGYLFTVDDFLEICRGAVGETYGGWKGGYFVMTKDTQVWVDNPGKCCYRNIMGVTENYNYVIINTDMIDI